MNLIKLIVRKYDYFCLWIWIKWFVHTEDVRLKAEQWNYKMNDKLKSRD